MSTSFKQLLTRVADESSHSLVSVLMQAKVFAAQLNSHEFRKWVGDELNGYTKEEEVPSYRSIPVQPFGDFWGPMGSTITNVGMSTRNIPPEFLDFFTVCRIRNNVGTLEGKLADDADPLTYAINHEGVQLLRAYSETQFTHYQLACAHLRVQRSQLFGILQSVRSHLLDLLLAIRDDCPELEQDENAITHVSREVPKVFIQQTIFHDQSTGKNTTMSNENINAGRDINVGRDLVVADSIRDSFNIIEQSSAPPELSEHLHTLTTAVESLCKEIEESKARQLAEDVNSLVSEATRTDRRVPILEGLGRTIRDAAQAIGDAATPILDAINSVFSMLGVTL